MPPQPPVEAFEHDDRRVNIPTADAHDLVDDGVHAPKILSVQRDTALDPQLVWRGKDAPDEALEVVAPPLWIQEKIDPRALVENLRRTAQRPEDEPEATLFDDFDGLDGFESIDYYRHQANWSNRMILGDSLEVMASLAEREDLRGQVQCIYIDPPYGIKFGSNWQPRTGQRTVQDRISDSTREVEQIKAFRDTWELGIHSYLSYLRDRLETAHALLTQSGSVFVQIGDENVHLVRSLMDEVFGRENFVAQIALVKAAGASSDVLSSVADYAIWYASQRPSLKFRPLLVRKTAGQQGAASYLHGEDNSGRRRRLAPDDASDVATGALRPLAYDNFTSQRPPGSFPISFSGKSFLPDPGYWKTGERGVERLKAARRLAVTGRTLRYVRYLDDFPVVARNNVWTDTATGSFTEDKIYVVQTANKVIERCLLMTTDPGDLVLDPTCGSGTTAYVAEQWGRRWITVDTSRVALALARQR